MIDIIDLMLRILLFCEMITLIRVCGIIEQSDIVFLLIHLCHILGIILRSRTRRLFSTLLDVNEVSACKKLVANFLSDIRLVQYPLDILYTYTLSQDRYGRPSITAIDVKTHRTSQVLYLTPYNQSESYYRPVSSGPSSSASSVVTKDGFETVSVKHVINFVMEIGFKQIGISMVNKRLQVCDYLVSRMTDMLTLCYGFIGTCLHHFPWL